MSHSVWLTKLAAAAALPYDDIADLARRWKRNEAITSLEVSAVLSPVLERLLEAQHRFTREELAAALEMLRNLAKSRERRTLLEDFQNLLRGDRRLALHGKQLPDGLRLKLGAGEQLSIEDIDVAQLWAVEQVSVIEASATVELRERVVERWCTYLAPRMFAGPHRPIQEAERLLKQMTRRAWGDHRRAQRKGAVPLGSSELMRVLQRARAPEAAPPVVDARHHERLLAAIELLQNRLRSKDRSLWRGRNPGRVWILLQAAKTHIDGGERSDLGEAVCSQLSAGLSGRRGKRGSLKLIERELSRRNSAMAVRPGTMRRTLKKLRQAVMDAAGAAVEVAPKESLAR